MEEWINKLWYMYTMEYLAKKKKKKERNLDICNDADGPSGHYAK